MICQESRKLCSSWAAFVYLHDGLCGVTSVSATKHMAEVNVRALCVGVRLKTLTQAGGRSSGRHGRTEAFIDG